MKRESPALRLLLPALLLASSVGMTVAQQTQGSTPPSSAPKEPQWVIVKGAVRNPRRIELRRRIRLLEALAFAGGITERAHGNFRQGIIRIEHAAGETAENAPPKISVYRLIDLARGDRKANPYLQGGDVVTVVERGGRLRQ